MAEVAFHGLKIESIQIISLWKIITHWRDPHDTSEFRTYDSPTFRIIAPSLGRLVMNRPSSYSDPAPHPRG